METTLQTARPSTTTPQQKVSKLLRGPEPTNPTILLSNLNKRLQSEAQNIPFPLGKGKAEDTWKVFSGQDIYDAKRKAGAYLEEQAKSLSPTLKTAGETFELLFNQSERRVNRILSNVALQSNRMRSLFEAMSLARDAVWSTTNKLGFGYEQTFVLDAMFECVKDLKFPGKDYCGDKILERKAAIAQGFVPFASINGQLIVCIAESDKHPPVGAINTQEYHYVNESDFQLRK